MSLASVLTGKGVTKAVKKAITKHKKKVLFAAILKTKESEMNKQK